MAEAQWEAEFARYFAAQVGPLHRLAYALCGEWHTAEDLVQTTFVKLYAHWDSIREDTLDAYAHRILAARGRSRSPSRPATSSHWGDAGWRRSGKRWPEHPRNVDPVGGQGGSVGIQPDHGVSRRAEPHWAPDHVRAA